MSIRAKLYIYANILVGAAVLACCLLFTGPPASPSRLTCYFVLAMLASTLKVRLPGVTGTISLSFLFVLIAIADLGWSETVQIAAGSAVVQSLWNRRKRPQLIQVAFNAAVLATSASFAWRAGRFLTPGAPGYYLPLLLALSATLYFFSNTFLVSGVISLVEQRPLLEVWNRCHLLTFPYYLAGAAAAALVSYCSRSVGWQAALLALPAMYLVYLFYKQCVERLSPPPVALPGTH
jgi:hypothetical protein